MGKAMRGIARVNIFVITAAMALLTVPIAVAQPASDPPPAPIPIQILTGKKVFISNGESTGDTEFRVSNLTYNAFYANMKIGEGMHWCQLPPTRIWSSILVLFLISREYFFGFAW